MDVSLSFNVVISKCLFDIKEEISNCGKQLEITHEQIVEIEKIQKSQVINATELGLLVQKLNLLLVDNFCLISKESKLIEHYTQLINVFNRSRGLVKNTATIQKNPISELVEYYQSKNRLDIVQTLEKYSYNLV